VLFGALCALGTFYFAVDAASEGGDPVALPVARLTLVVLTSAGV
jgi:hypothetical protein